MLEDEEVFTEEEEVEVEEEHEEYTNFVTDGFVEDESDTEDDNLRPLLRPKGNLTQYSSDLVETDVEDE